MVCQNNELLEFDSQTVMKPEITDESPAHKFLLATFRVDPTHFVERFTSENTSFIQEMFFTTIRELARTCVEQWMLPQYNDEAIRAFERIANSQWDSIRVSGISSPFEMMKRFVEKILILQRDIPVYKISRANNWNTVTAEMGDDVFVAALYASIFDKQGSTPGHFQWQYITPSSFFSLNNLLAKERLTENHYHLSGSSPNMDLSWIRMMNNPYGSDHLFSGFPREDPFEMRSASPEKYIDDMRVLVRIAAYIRLRLFEECCLESTQNPWNLPYVINRIKDIWEDRLIVRNDYVNEMISVHKFLSAHRGNGGEVIDYAIRDYVLREDLDYVEISGERHLFYCCLRQIYRYDERSFDIQVLFYLYLLIRFHFDGMFVQRNNRYGFDNFQRYQRSKTDLIRGTVYERIAVRMALKYTVKENFIDSLEARITPSDTTNALRATIGACDMESGLDRKQFAYILHFIKQRGGPARRLFGDDSAIPVCRESSLRARLKKEAAVVESLRREPRDASFRIVGIDAASHEVDCRPENFGQAFRFLSNLRHHYQYLHYDPERVHLPDLHKTFHVGEDFYDIIDGLRAIDEAILFLQLKHGDRIGHGVALGLDPAEYYGSRKIIALPLQNALDNVGWCLYCIQKLKVAVSTEFYAFLNVSFGRYFNMLHQRIAEREKLFPADLMTYINGWKLRGDNPDCYYDAYEYHTRWKHLRGYYEWDRNNFVDRSKYHEIDENTYNLYRWYHFDEGLKKAAATLVEFKITEEYIELTRKLQAVMRNFVLKKGVAIESNPTSNLRISNLDEADHLPIFTLFPVDEEKSGLLRLNTSVNTDDQGVFYTSLVKEYTILANALQRRHDENDFRVHSDDTILRWISDLIANGKRQCFVQR
jgi:adenosine deaminase